MSDGDRRKARITGLEKSTFIPLGCKVPKVCFAVLANIPLSVIGRDDVDIRGGLCIVC